MTANCEYSDSNRGNLPLPIQIKLSKKTWTFSGIVFAFLVSTWNFQRSETKNEPHRLSISDVADSEICACLNA